VARGGGVSIMARVFDLILAALAMPLIYVLCVFIFAMVE